MEDTDRYSHDLERIQNVLGQHGYTLGLWNSIYLHDKYNGMLADGLPFLPESDEELWDVLQKHLNKP